MPTYSNNEISIVVEYYFANILNEPSVQYFYPPVSSSNPEGDIFNEEYFNDIIWSDPSKALVWSEIEPYITIALEEYDFNNTQIPLPVLKTRLNNLESGKVDKVEGKGLSENDFTNAYKIKLDGIDNDIDTRVDDRITDLIGTAPANLDTLGEIATALANEESATAAIITSLAGKVDKVTGKGLSTEDFTTAEKNKLAALNNTVAAPAAFSLALTGAGATGTQVHATKQASVQLSYSTQVTYSLTGTPASRVTLKACATNSTNEGDWLDMGSTETRQPTGLSITVGQVVGAIGQITSGILPAGWYVKAVASGAGTHSESFVSGVKNIHG